MPANFRHLFATTIMAAAAAAMLASCSDNDEPSASASSKPNILFIVLDDAGVDLMTAYGYGGDVPPRTPNINAIAKAGLLFRNAWAMPDCTPTRATFFTGRFPSQTNVVNALMATDLANSEPSPYEVTVPKLLKTVGYTSALIGKMHLTGSDLESSLGTAFNLPYGYQSMWKLGFDYFDGFLDGAPYNIDTRAGDSRFGSDPADGPYKCGYVPTTHIDGTNGADAGACYQADGSCTQMTVGGDIVTPGRSCMEQGGLFDRNAACQSTMPAYLDFATQNGYYTGRWVQSNPDGSSRVIPASDPSSRGYRSTLETDRAIAWAKAQPAGKPWMLTVGYSAIHAPLQVPPVSLISDSTPGRNDNLVCYPLSENENTPDAVLSATDLIDSHLVTNLMVEAADTEIGRLMVSLGLAAYNADGTLDYHPEQTNTVVVFVGDNGTYVNSVKFTEPGKFDPKRAKASPYQTGVWVPLLVAGPMVKQPGREVPYMVNSTDLYQLFGEIAGADVDAAIPANRPIDGKPMMAYLTDPGQAAIRSSNFTEMGTNFRPTNAADSAPCVVEAANNVCTTLFPQEGVCRDQGGIWYGNSKDDPNVPAGGFQNCCQVQQFRLSEGKDTTFLPVTTKAVTDGQYKLVRQTRNECEPAIGTDSNPANYQYSASGYSITDEFYEITTPATGDPQLDRAGSELTAITAPPLDTSSLGNAQQQAYGKLKTEMDQHDAVAKFNQDYDSVSCPGDGNRDFVVDQKDLDNWQELSQLNGGQSSWYDFNHDGKTDAADKTIIQNNLGKTCATS